MSENVMSEKTLQAKTPINNESPVNLHKKKKLTAYNVVVYGVLGIFSLLCFFPLAYVLLLSFSTEADWMNSTLLVIPKNFHFENYKALKLYLRQLLLPLPLPLQSYTDW